MHVMFFLFNNIFLSLLPGRYKHHTKNVQYHLISWQILLKGWCKAHNSLLNTSSPKLEACNKQFSAAKFPLAFPWLFHHIWSIPSLFPNSSQIPWHCQVSTRVLLVLVDVEGEVDLGHLCRLWEWAASQSGKEDLRLGHVWVTVRLRLCPHLSASTPQHGRRLHIRNPLLLLLLLLHPFNGLFSRTTRASWYQKGKTDLDLNEARYDGVWVWQRHQMDHMQTICTSLQTANHTNTLSNVIIIKICAALSTCRPTSLTYPNSNPGPNYSVDPLTSGSVHALGLLWITSVPTLVLIAQAVFFC